MGHWPIGGQLPAGRHVPQVLFAQVCLILSPLLSPIIPPAARGMAYYPNAIVVAASNDESQGPESPVEASSADVKAFYEEVERREALERKLSKPKSGTSMWSRRSSKRPTTAPATPATTSELPRLPSKSDLHEKDASDEANQEGDRVNRNSGHQLSASRSVIADSRDGGSWTGKAAWADVPLASFKVKYPLHNPMGPRWYRNHHLIPPSQKKPSMRPPTFFSPSFPPIHTSSSPGHALDDAEGPDGNSSNSPQATPTSSQTRVAEGGKRSRKTSQTTPDNVDLLDVTDPWGQSWHHRSPYDFDYGNTPASSPENDVPNRTRRASMTAMQNKHQSVTPSPLSQSTSAVHLPGSLPQIHIPRKLSKRRTPTADTIFNPPPPKPELRKAASAPQTPVDTLHVAPYSDAQPEDSTVLPKRMSVAPPPAQSAMYQTPKKEKRGSMLNRLAKKFSLLRKSTDDQTAGKEYWHHVDDQEVRGYNMDSQTTMFDRQSTSPEKARPESVRRVPPPADTIEDPVAAPAPAPPPVEQTEADRVSLSSLDTPYSMGRLTIANPDLPDSEKDAVITDDVPIPPEIPQEIDRSRNSNAPPAESFLFPPSPLQLSPNDAWSRFDKPLPPPQLATPKFSELGLTVPATPEVVEQPLPPPPPPSEKPSPTRSHSKSQSAQSPTDNSLRKSSQPRRTPSPGPIAHSPADVSRTMSPPILSSLVNETPKRSSSQAKPPVSITKDLPLSPETTPERSRTQSPPMPQSFSQYETPKATTSQALPSELSRRMTMSPEPANLAKNLGHERAATTQPSTNATRETRDRAPEASSSNRRSSKLTKPSRHQSSSTPAPAPALAPIPFPTTTAPVQAPDNPRDRDDQIYAASPLSTSSMLANPPTPYDYRHSLALTPDQSAPPSLPPKSIYEGKTSHEPPPIRTSPVNASPSNPSPSRQTETFKLVRSSSGNVYSSGQTITAQGQQWEVVESVESKARKEKSSSRNKDQEHRSRENERKSKEPEHKSRDHERRSKEYEPRSKEAEHRDYEQRPREHEQRSREPERKSAYRSKNPERTKDNERPKDYELPKDYERSKEKVVERSKPRDYDLPKDYDRSKGSERPKDYERSKDRERTKDYERSREHEKSKDYEKSRDLERSREHERSGEKDRTRDAERSKDYTKSRDQDRRPKEYEPSSRRESKKESRPTLEVANADYHRSSNRASKPAAPYPEEPPKSRTNGKSSSRHVEEPSKSSRHRDEQREHKSDHKSAEASSSSNHHIRQSQISVAQPSQPSAPLPPARLERIPSLTARPISELPSAAEMSAIRAKESWDMERLWKARSMYGLEPNAPTTNFIHGPGSSSSRSDDAPTHSAVYGSSHTAYVVQSPFQGSGRGSQIYHSMPTAPPPIIYSSPAYIPSIPDSLSSYDPDEHVYRSYHTPQATYQAPAMDYRASPPSMPRPPLNNPLPEPPRESPFDPAKSTSRPNNRHSNDYWSKYNGITTAH